MLSVSLELFEMDSLIFFIRPLDKSLSSFLKSAKAVTIFVAAALLGTLVAEDEVRLTLLTGRGLRLREKERSCSVSSL